MKKHITDEKTGISYTLHGDYYLLDLALSSEKKADWHLRAEAFALSQRA